MWTLILGALTLLISVLILFSVCALAFFLFIFSISFSVTTSECPDSPLLPCSFLLPPSRLLIFLFPPVNINTGLMCTPAQMFALEELTAHIVGHGHHVSPYLLGIPGPFLTHSAHEKVTDKLSHFFTFSESRRTVTSDMHCLIKRFEGRFYTWRIAASYVTF